MTTIAKFSLPGALAALALGGCADFSSCVESASCPDVDAGQPQETAADSSEDDDGSEATATDASQDASKPGVGGAAEPEKPVSAEGVNSAETLSPESSAQGDSPSSDGDNPAVEPVATNIAADPSMESTDEPLEGDLIEGAADGGANGAEQGEAAEEGEATEDQNETDETEADGSPSLIPACGDGSLDPGEQCDEGPANDNQGSCTEACTTATCGDGFTQPGEQCDEGSANHDAGWCTTACRSASCGDGLVQSGEVCDEGSANDNQGNCTESCTQAACGDGFVQAGEACDDANSNDSDSCLTSCEWASCGDGEAYSAQTDAANPNSTEECDDGNSNDDDGCTNQCLTYACNDNCFCKNRACVGIDKISVGADFGCALDVDGDVWCWGDNGFGAVGQPGFAVDVPPTRMTTLEDVVDVETTGVSSCAAKGDGSVWCWGSAGSGRLGDGGAESSPTFNPVAVRTSPTAFLSDGTDLAGKADGMCALRGNADGSAWCWGNNAQVPDGTDTNVAVRAGTIAGLTEIVGGDDIVYGRTGYGAWNSWGVSGLTGQTGADGAGLRPPGPVRTGSQQALSFTDIAAGEGAACGLVGTQMWCWGYLPYEVLVNQAGTNYVPEMTESPWPGTAAQASVGVGHICVLNQAGAVHCTGSNERQALGNAGGNLYDAFVQVNGPSSIKQIDTLDYHTCALSSNDEVWCWGQFQPVRHLEPVED